MLRCKTLFAIVLFTPIVALGQGNAGAAGLWRTIDDDSGKPQALVRIVEQDGVLTGRIEKLFREPNEDQNPTCTDCSDARKDKPVLGMTILTGLKHEPDGAVWSGGEILDPNNGKVYRSKATLSADGKQLVVRGYIGVPWLGRSQIWLREQ
jgi:uncharacterized protein (DUF2147 family)